MYIHTRYSNRRYLRTQQCALRQCHERTCNSTYFDFIMTPYARLLIVLEMIILMARNCWCISPVVTHISPRRGPPSTAPHDTIPDERRGMRTLRKTHVLFFGRLATTSTVLLRVPGTVERKYSTPSAPSEVPREGQLSGFSCVTPSCASLPSGSIHGKPPGFGSTLPSLLSSAASPGCDAVGFVPLDPSALLPCSR